MTDTTTEEPVQPAEGGEQPQPEAVQAEAETPEPQEQVEQAEPVEETDTSEDFDAKVWLEKKGIKSDDPEALAKLAKMAHSSEQRMHQATTSSASELKKSLDSQQVQKVDDNPRIQQLYEDHMALKRNVAVDSFKREVGLTPEKEAKMVGYMAEHPEKAYLVNNGYMTLQELYMLSGADAVDVSAAKAQGRQEALRQLANHQRASAVTGAAQKPGFTPAQDDPILAALQSDD